MSHLKAFIITKMNKELVFKADFWLWQGYLVDWQWISNENYTFIFIL